MEEMMGMKWGKLVDYLRMTTGIVILREPKRLKDLAPGTNVPTNNETRTWGEILRSPEALSE
jgi:hypothetical protein